MPDTPSGQIVEMIRELCDPETAEDRRDELTRVLVDLLSDDRELGED